MLGEVVDRIAAVEQYAGIAVDKGDLGFAARGRGEARIVGEDAGLAVELAHVQHLRTDRPVVERERIVLVAERQLASFGVRAGFRVHDRILAVRQPSQCGARGLGAKTRVQHCRSGSVAVAQRSVHCKKIGCYRDLRQPSRGAAQKTAQAVPAGCRAACVTQPPGRRCAPGSHSCRAAPSLRKFQARWCARSTPPAAAVPPHQASAPLCSAKFRTARSVSSAVHGSTAASPPAISRSIILRLGR